MSHTILGKKLKFQNQGKLVNAPSLHTTMGHFQARLYEALAVSYRKTAKATLFPKLYYS